MQPPTCAELSLRLPTEQGEDRELEHQQVLVYAAHPSRALTDGGVVDVVIGCDHPQVQRGHIHLVLDADALGLLQVTEGLLHQLREVIRQVPVGHACR